MRTITYRADESLKKVVIPIGFVGENEHTRVIFDCAHIFREYPSATASIAIRPPVGNEYPGIVVHDADTVYWDVTSADLTHKGLGEIQLTFTQGTKICKTYVTSTLTSKSIMGNGPVPSALDDFISRASAAVTAIPDTINAALEAAKASGEFDGFSPTVSVTEIEGGHRVTITDANGDHSFDVMDGQGGGGLPAGGSAGDVLIKSSGTDYAAAWVAPATSAEQDNTRPITAAAVYTEIGNINALLATI